MSDHLRDAYNSAVIDIASAQGVVTTVPVQGPPQRLIDLPDGAAHVHIITACNPRSERLPRGDNEDRNRSLEQDLDAAGLAHRPAVGRSRDSSWAEPSFAVLDADEAVVLALAERWEQHAIYRITATDVTVVWTGEGGASDR